MMRHLTVGAQPNSRGTQRNSPKCSRWWYNQIVKVLRASPESDKSAGESTLHAASVESVTRCMCGLQVAAGEPFAGHCH